MRRGARRLSSTLLRSVLAYTVAILLCFACAFSAFFYMAYEQEEAAKLEAIARNAAARLDDEDPQEDARVLASQLEANVRYTLVDPAGDVIFDSEGVEGENHADRPEIVEARQKGMSSVMRYSSTLGRDTIYAAVLLSSGDVLRLSEQRASFATVFESMAPALVAALAGALLLSVALSRVLARRAVAPFEQIDVADPLGNDAYEEMQPLLSRIEAQQRQLRDQNRELARAEGLRREFSANVSHELKTPLQVISGYAELLSKGGIPEADAMAFADVILKESEGMGALIDDVLVLSRIDDPVMENAGKESLDLFELAQGVARRLDPLAAKRSVRIRCLGSPVVVEGNRGLLDQLVSNLVSNAVKYSEPGGDVVVSVGKAVAGPDAAESPVAFVRVKDSGCGIPADEQGKVFERFYRVDKSRSKESGGTGLGLAIAKHAAAFHDATIAVQSEVGKGSVFTVRIPLPR